MAEINFTTYITDEACERAREAIEHGWHLTPKRWAVSAVASALNPQRTYASMNTSWTTQQFSSISAVGTNRLMHTVAIPPNAYASVTSVAEIYFIYTDYHDNEFLFAIAQPNSAIEYRPGVSQSYSFIFGLNNTTVDDLYTINYTYPQDIADHNSSQSNDIHTMFLRVNGSRAATGILKYDAAKTFTTDRDIVDKGYVDGLTAIDNETIQRIDGSLVSTGNLTINEVMQNYWIGNPLEYQAAVSDGDIESNTICWITDD